VPSTGPTALPLGADAYSPSFSRSGGELLFHVGRRAGSLMRASLAGDGGVARIEPVLDDGAANFHAVLSPDGRSLAFDSDRDGVRGVFIVPAHGGTPSRVSGDGYAAIPSWSPDGRYLAFIKADTARPRVWQIWIAETATGLLRRVTAHTAGQPWGASWFPDGRHIAYSVEDRLVVADIVSHADDRSFRSPRPGRLVRTPAVSPDGRRIVFQVFGDGVWLLDLDAQRVTRMLTDRTAEEFVWYRDGRAIAYHARRGSTWSLWRLGIPTT
jgi:TolB protein